MNLDAVCPLAYKSVTYVTVTRPVSLFSVFTHVFGIKSSNRQGKQECYLCSLSLSFGTLLFLEAFDSESSMFFVSHFYVGSCLVMLLVTLMHPVIKR